MAPPYENVRSKLISGNVALLIEVLTLTARTQRSLRQIVENV